MLTPTNTSLVCPHCYGKIDLAVSIPDISPYSLSIICVTKWEGRAPIFIRAMETAAKVLGADFLVGIDRDDFPLDVGTTRALLIHTNGYVEGGLNQLARRAQGQFILRLDDDESISPLMLEWLRERRYMGYPAWAFPTAALWGDEEYFITTPPFWPDTHIRLTAWHLAADWPDEPHGKPKWERQAKIAPVAIRHHKFLVKNYEQRKAIADTYESKLEGGGHGRRMVFNCPENVLTQLTISSVGEGPATNIQQNAGEVIKIR